MVDPEHIVDFSLMLQINTIDKDRQRPVKRGKQGERLVRPSDERFGNNENFLVGEFRPVRGVKEGDGCYWLGWQFRISTDYKPFTVKTVVQGLMEHQRTWTENQIAEWKQSKQAQGR